MRSRYPLVILATLAVFGLSLRGRENKPLANTATPLGETLKARGYLEFPIHIGDQSNWWYLDVEFNGQPASFVIDTGDAQNTVAKESAERLGFKLMPLPGVREAFLDRPAAEQYHPHSAGLKMGSLATSAFPFSVRTFGATIGRLRDGRSFDGMLGAPFLTHYAAVLDYEAGKLYLRDPADRLKPLQGRWRITRYESDGEARPGEQAVGFAVEFRGDKLVFEQPWAKTEYSYCLNKLSSPNRMTWVSDDGGGRHVSFAVDQDKLTLAQAIRREDTHLYWPPKLTTARGCGYSVLHFERVK